MNDSDCIFCKIVSGDLPCTRVYEDEAVLAFMDIGPLVKGHTLVIPKEHIDPITRASDAILARIIVVARNIAEAQLKTLGADGVNIHQANGSVAGQVVPHLHVHVIPRFENDNHHWNWNAASYETADEMAAIAARIQSGLPQKV